MTRIEPFQPPLPLLPAGPWAWRQRDDWSLVALPIAGRVQAVTLLDAVQSRTHPQAHRTSTVLRLAGELPGQMIPFRNDHPVARCLESAADLYGLLRKCLPHVPIELALEARNVLQWIERD